MDQAAANKEFRYFEKETLVDPYEFYELARPSGPVVRVQNPERETYLVLSYQALREVAEKPEVFSSKPAGYPGPNFYPRAEAYLKEHGYGRLPHIISSDPPRHTAYRRVLAKALRDKRVHSLRPRIREIANALIDDFVARGRCEFVMDYAWRLAVLLMAELLGVEKTNINRFREWGDAWVLPLEQPLSEEHMLACVRKIAELQHYFADKLADRTAKPQDDLLTDIAHAKVDLGEGLVSLRLHEQLAICEALLIAGNSSTAHALSLGMLRLAEFPDIAGAIRGQRKLISRFAEESLRYEAAIQSNFRTVAEETEFHGQRMSKGAQVLLCWGAANRDAKVFEDPDTFSMGRPSPQAHMAFGHGIHACAGAALARQELTESYDLLLQRLGEIRLADGVLAAQLRRTGGIVTHGVERLPIEFVANDAPSATDGA